MNQCYAVGRSRCVAGAVSMGSPAATWPILAVGALGKGGSDAAATEGYRVTHVPRQTGTK